MTIPTMVPSSMTAEVDSLKVPLKASPLASAIGYLFDLRASLERAVRRGGSAIHKNAAENGFRLLRLVSMNACSQGLQTPVLVRR
jgi:hypothetical protein